MNTGLHRFHPKLHVLHIKDTVIKPADPAHSCPSAVRLFVRINVEGTLAAESRPYPQFKGDDHWKVDLVDLMFPMGIPLILITVLREAETPVEIGSAYFDPQEFVDQDGQVSTLEVISEDPDFPALELHFLVHLGGKVSTNTQDPYADLNDVEFMICLNQLSNLRPADESPPPLIDEEVASSIEKRAHRLSAKELRSNAFRFLGDIYLRRFQASRLKADREAAHSMYEGSLLILGKSDDLSSVEREIRQLADANYTKQMRLWVLSDVLLNRHYKEGGNSKALVRSALLGEQALLVTPRDPITVERYALLYAQAVILYHKFERFPEFSHLDQSISFASEAIDIAPKTLAARRIFLNTLANGLQRRYTARFVQSDVERAIDAYDEILNITDDDHPSLPGYLNNLGITLLDRYRLLGKIADLERSITVREKMLLITPDEHPAKPMFINTFCGELLERHKALGSKEDLDRCIELQEIVVAITPDAHLDKSDMVKVLGAAYASRFEIDGNLSDLDQAIELFTAKIALTDPQDVSQGTAEFSLADAFISRFHHTGEVSEMRRALELYEACTTLLRSPWNRFIAAMRWAVTASELAKVDLQEGAASQFKACTVAMDLLPQLSWLGSPIETRREVLKRAQNITTIAVSRAILVKEYNTALAWVEQGRSVMWTQLLQLRVPVDDLRLVDSSLAQKLSYLAEQLSSNSTKAGVPPARGDVATSGYSGIEAGGIRHRQLVTEWTDTVEQVRQLPGFSRFLQPKNAEELCIAAQAGPVVIVHVNENESNAFILVPGESEGIVLSLGKFTSDDVYRLRDLLVRVTEEDLAYRAPSSSRAAFLAPFEELEPYEIFESILSELWYKIVSPVLQALAYNVPEGPVKSRIHWCPTGPLALLPLHAAGDYSKTEPGFKVFEYVVSSYTPTLSALIPAAKTEDLPEGDVTLLAVAVSSPVGQFPIPGTHEEVESIGSRFSDIHKQECFAVLTESAATPDRVLAGMKKANWVHFACHGVQNLVSPTDNALLLSGTSQLKLSDLVETSLPSAELAFLSACQTAAGDKDLPEESVHLAAGMLLAGYKGVIATMWSIMDRDAPAVADDVYRYLLRDATRRPDYREAAYALHHAVGQLREDHGTRSYLSWVPFVHFGM